MTNVERSTEGSFDHADLNSDCWQKWKEHEFTACAICGVATVSIAEMEKDSLPQWRWLSQVTLLTDDNLLFLEGRFPKLRSPLRVNGRPTDVLPSDYMSSCSAPFHRHLWDHRPEEFRYDRSDTDPSDRIIRRIHAQPLNLAFFVFLPGRRDIHSPNMSWNSITYEDHGEYPVVEASCTSGKFHPQLYLAFHDSCLELMDRFCDGTPDITLPQIWDILRPATEDGGFCTPFAAQLRDLPTYYWGDASSMEWYGDSWGDQNTPKAFTANPLRSDYTMSLLSFLTQLPDETPSRPVSTSITSLTDILPPELVDLIVSYMNPSIDIPINCTRTFAPGVWKDLLLHSDLFPLLWDIDKDLVEQTAISNPQADWELLVRSIAQPDGFKKFDEFRKSWTLGLRNRRRIWANLENLRANVLSSSEQALIDATPASWAPEYDSKETPYVTAISTMWVTLAEDTETRNLPDRVRGRTRGHRGRANPRGGYECPSAHWRTHWRRESR